MDQEDQTLNPTAEVENSDDISSISEPEATVDEVVEPTEPTGEEEETIEETESDSKKGYSNRVRELNSRAKEAEERARELEEEVMSLTEMVRDRRGESPAEIPNIPDEPLIQPGEEIDATELDRRLRAREQNMMRRTDALLELKARQNEAINRIQNEAEKALKTHPELDPDSNSFNRELAQAITEATEAYVSKNPYSASVTKFVDKMMRPYKGAVSKEVGGMASEMAKQVSSAAVKPTSVRQKEKPVTEKSIAELEAELDFIQA